jgi:hypothetical protein
MILAVFEYGSIRDLGMCLSVCSAWKTLASTNNLWGLLMVSCFHSRPPPPHLSSSVAPNWKSLVKDEATNVVRYHSDVVPSNSCDLFLRLVLLGDAGVGKTSFVVRFDQDSPEPTVGKGISTVGVDFKVKTCMYKKKIVKVKNIALFM